MKEIYSSKEELALDIIKNSDIPDSIKFNGFDKYNRILFDFNINLEKSPVHVVSEIVGKANFVDRYFIQNIHRVKKAK